MFNSVLKKDGVNGTVAVGCGGAGCNIVNRLGTLSDVDMLTVNTDRKGLVRSRSNLRILLGSGSNSGGDVDIGTELARASSDRIEKGIAGYRNVIVMAGLGGGTGTGSAKIVSEIAKRNGSRVIAILSIPMSFESGRREVAMDSLPEIAEHSDILVVLDGDRLAKIDPMIGAREAFSVLDQMVCESFAAMVRMLDNDHDGSVFKAMEGFVTVSFADGMDADKVADRLIRGLMMDADIRSEQVLFVRGNIPNGTISETISKSTGMTPMFVQGPEGRGMNIIMFSPIICPCSSL